MCTAFLNFCGSSSAHDRCRPCVEQVALAVALEDGAEIPAVAVVVGELGVLELRVELGDLAEELEVAPLAAHRRAFRIAIEDLAHLLVASGYCCFSGHMNGASDS